MALIIVAPAGVWHQPEAHAWVCYHRVAEYVPLTITSDSTVRPTGETR